MGTDKTFSPDVLTIDCKKETEKITYAIRDVLKTKLRKRGLVIGVSGGIDSSVSLALCVKAVGADRVFALMMPERHSAEDTGEFSALVADHFSVEKALEDITDILEALGFYQRYNDAVRLVIPEYDNTWKSKIVIPGLSNNNDALTFFSIVAQSPDGNEIKKRLSLEAYLGVVAATNFKQRTRKMLEYYHADRLNYAVVGTPNRLEYDQGFFVKNGDGAADIKPIAHLYKSQVYQMAEYLEVPAEIRKRPPTTDTYSLEQGQDEFYFMLPYDKMDCCLYAKNNAVALEDLAEGIGLTIEQVQRVFKDIDQKRSTTRYLHFAPLLVDTVAEIKGV